MKNSLLIITLILLVSNLRASGQNAVDTLKQTAPSVDTLVGASVHTPNRTASNTPIDTSAPPVDTLTRTTVSTFADTLINAYADTPIDTLVSASVNTYTDTVVNTVNNAPVDTSNRSVNTSADTSAEKSTAKKIFLLPAYTFHVLFLAVCVALIAATLYFFLTRRNRNDSRRFLTTTRLSVLDKLVQRGCRHIESSYPDPALTPETVCNSLVTGKAYLDALFMNELGINVQDFIIQVRVNAIKNRLSADQTPDINEICAECGFADREEAERCFSNICGGVGIAEFARFSKMQNQKR